MDVLIFLLISLTPTLEPRYALAAAVLSGWPVFTSFLLASLIVPVLAALLIAAMHVADTLLPKIPGLRKLWRWYVVHVRRKATPYVNRYGLLGLILFVAVPLPGTGIWTGALAAYLLGMDRQRAFLALTLGGIVSNIIVAFGLLFGIALFPAP